MQHMNFKNVISKQLKEPKGYLGLYIGYWMNKLNEGMYQMVFDHLDTTNSKSILELGIGNGKFLFEIAKKNQTIHFSGIDISKTLLRKAKKNNSEFIKNGQVNILYGNVNAIPYADSSFDSIYSTNTIYFWENPAAVLEEIKRVLKPNGKLLLALNTHHDMTLNQYDSKFFTFYSEEKVIALLEGNGFRIIGSYYKKFEREDSLLLVARY